ncbi:hypothetical protein F2P81_011325 [Scophthalmus maximus]|uniref:Uncharacterized protein n=1 Tax=Scophthalmus maximus TaxID=52904 RepID=A0A6A4SPU4_SCOMX|nr:hypothetical protein F2P81_011325 [Scophthalmus maximus]
MWLRAHTLDPFLVFIHISRDNQHRRTHRRPHSHITSEKSQRKCGCVVIFDQCKRAETRARQKNPPCTTNGRQEKEESLTRKRKYLCPEVLCRHLLDGNVNYEKWSKVCRRSSTVCRGRFSCEGHEFQLKEMLMVTFQTLSLYKHHVWTMVSAETITLFIQPFPKQRYRELAVVTEGTVRHFKYNKTKPNGVLNTSNIT